MKVYEISAFANNHGMGELTKVVVQTKDGKEHEIYSLLAETGAGAIALSQLTDEAIAQMGEKKVILVCQ